MADYVSAKITISGELSRSRAAGFWKHVQSDRAGPDCGVRFIDAAEFEQHLCVGASGVTFHGDEVRRGEFERIQSFCVEHGLTYLLTYDGCGGEWGPARLRWRPGEGEGTTCSLDGDGGAACITAAEIGSLGFSTVEAVTEHLASFDYPQPSPFVLVEG